MPADAALVALLFCCWSPAGFQAAAPDSADVQIGIVDTVKVRVPPLEDKTPTSERGWRFSGSMGSAPPCTRSTSGQDRCRSNHDRMVCLPPELPLSATLPIRYVTDLPRCRLYFTPVRLSFKEVRHEYSSSIPSTSLISHTSAQGHYTSGRSAGPPGGASYTACRLLPPRRICKASRDQNAPPPRDQREDLR